MNKKKAENYILPENISVKNVSKLLIEIIKISADSTVVLDFIKVKEVDSFGIAFINHILHSFNNIIPKNLNVVLKNKLNTFSSETETLDIEPEPIVKSKIGQYLGLKILNLKKNVQRYFILLADEIHYTIQFIINRRGVYRGEIFNQLYMMAYDSFPIVCLISFLIGITISISSFGQLQKFGADIYLANLVGFGMIRELVPLMTGIILAGKIGASITAEISSMKVLEELDALKSMGIIPEKFLMVPRIIAITFAIPLLIGMADLVSIFGGLMVSHFFSEIPSNIFLERVFRTVDFFDFFIGLSKAMIFGWVVVISAGYKGFSVEKGAEEVGIATTESVVFSISLIIILDCIFALLLY